MQSSWNKSESQEMIKCPRSSNIYENNVSQHKQMKIPLFMWSHSMVNFGLTGTNITKNSYGPSSRI